GGTFQDHGNGVAVDAAGNAYVVGTTGAHDFPTTPNALQSTAPSASVSAFITKLNATGSGLIYSTYFGATNYTEGNSIAIDAGGRVRSRGRGVGAAEYGWRYGMAGQSRPSGRDGRSLRPGSDERRRHLCRDRRRWHLQEH